MSEEKTIAVFCASHVKREDLAYLEAYRIGRALAEAGFVVMNGGYKGAMEALSKGAAEAGAKPIGVTCQSFKGAQPNNWIKKEIHTADLWKRLDVFMQTADGFLILEGRTGTLVELSVVLEYVAKGFLKKKPIIFFKEYWRPLINIFENYTKVDSFVCFTNRIKDIPELFSERLRIMHD